MDYIKYILFQLITFLHILFVMFVILTPFIGSNYFLLLHIIIIPFIMFHWILNDNSCFLTLVERSLGKSLWSDYDDANCVTCQLVEPVYDFKNNYDEFSQMIYISTIILWLLSVFKLYKRYSDGKIRGWRDLFKVRND